MQKLEVTCAYQRLHLEGFNCVLKEREKEIKLGLDLALSKNISVYLPEHPKINYAGIFLFSLSTAVTC